MSQQINLYDPALRKKRELLTAINVAAGAAALALFVGAWAAWAHHRLGALEAKAPDVAARLKALQDRQTALANQLASAKPDPALAQELAEAQAEAAGRREVLAVLEKGLGPAATRFADYLRGLARQSGGNLWLTGFSVDADSDAMEIRGRMLDPAALPDYIKRLNGEKAFQGRSFAALTVKAGASDAAAAATAPSPAPAAGPAYSEFTLVPAKTDKPAGAQP